MKKVMAKKSKRKQPIIHKVAKVPLVIQMNALEGGAACLAMVLSYYDKWVPLEQVSLDCGISRNTCSEENLMKAANGYDLQTECHAYSWAELKEKATYPCVLSLKNDQFTVLCGFKRDKAIVNSPLLGNVSWSKNQMELLYKGTCITFLPNVSFTPAGEPRSLKTFISKRMKGAGVAFGLAIFTTIISSLLGMLTPAMANVFADRLLTGRNMNWFYPFLIGMAIIGLIQIIISWIQSVYSLKVDGKIAIVSDSEYMWHVLHLPMSFFSQRMAGDLMSRRSQNAAIANQLINTFAPLAIQTVWMFFYLFIILRYSPILSFFGIFSVLFNNIVARWISKKRVNVTRRIKRDTGNKEGTTITGLEMIETIKASGAEDGFFERWAGYQASANAGNVETRKINAYFGLGPTVVSIVTNMLVLMGSVYLCMQGKWTIGMISAFSGFLNSFLSPARQLISVSQTVQEMESSIERIDDVMAYPQETVPEIQPTDQPYEKLSGRMEMKHVTFGYSKMEAPVVEDFNLSLEPGKSIAIVGSSGCGKSTLMKLISGLEKPWSGEILFDGKPITEIDHTVFVSSLSVVSQDIVLFDDSIVSNIKMWDSSIKDRVMTQAAKDASIHEDILQRPGGYYHRLQEQGKDFSGGQRQRLEIARALAQEPSILLMDEATSALDAKTEYEVVQAIKKRGISCIMVAHRLSTIKDCDEIIVLNHGKVIERGNHKELYARNGYYTKLIQSE